MVFHGIVCDGCKAVGEAAPRAGETGKSLALLRTVLRHSGWRTLLNGGKDFCKDCVAAGKDKT